MDRTTNKFPKVGNEAFSATPAPVLRGTLVPKKGNAKGGADPGAGTATHRGGVPQERLGASYRITVGRSYTQTDARIQANGRIVPSATGVNQPFRAGW